MDQNPPRVGLLAVFAVSGSVVFIARLVHKRLVSDFMKKMELEFTGGSGKLCQVKKKVRFAEDVIVRECSSSSRGSDFVRKTEDGFENRQVLYQQILEYKTLIKP